MIIKLTILLLFFVVMVAVGIYARRHAGSVDGFVLGGRSVGPWLTAFAYGTSYFSAVVFVGYAGQFGWKYGLASTWIGIGNAVIGSLLAWVILGGYMATAINDFIQGIIMLAGILAVIAAVLAGQGGFMEAVGKMAQIPSDVEVTMGQPGAFTSFFGPDPLNLLGVVILTSLGTWGLPQMIHKFYTIRDEKSIQTGTIISTVFAIIVSGGCYFLGGFGRLFDSPEIYGTDGSVVYDSIIPFMLSGLPDILVGIVVILVLSASMSTLSSLVLTSSSTLTLDFLKDTVMKKMSERGQIIVMQLLIVFFIILSVVLALDPPAFIAQLMGISWGALAGAFLAPFLYGLYWKRTTRMSVWASFAAGIGITVSNMLIGYIDSPINAGALAMGAGMIIVPVVSLLTPKPSGEHIDRIFACYDETVVIKKKHSLEEE